jgi:hypothetical protein
MLDFARLLVEPGGGVALAVGNASIVLANVAVALDSCEQQHLHIYYQSRRCFDKHVTGLKRACKDQYFACFYGFYVYFLRIDMAKPKNASSFATTLLISKV